MSSFKNFAPTLTSLQAQADGTGTIAGSPIEDFLSIAGYETPGGGGGGESDLTTATLTMITDPDHSGSSWRIDTLCFISDAIGDYPDCTMVTTAYSEDGGADFKIPLYKGVCLIDLTAIIVSDTPVITGDAEIAVIEGTTWLKITGDCTITAYA